MIEIMNERAVSVVELSRFSLLIAPEGHNNREHKKYENGQWFWVGAVGGCYVLCLRAPVILHTT